MYASKSPVTTQLHSDFGNFNFGDESSPSEGFKGVKPEPVLPKTMSASKLVYLLYTLVNMFISADICIIRFQKHIIA